jgi:uncharacterized membrane protein
LEFTSSDLYEWLNLLARWVHVFAGILWIGQTYFFTWLDGRFAALERETTDMNNRVWMVHSGGFYIVEKQKKPELQPRTLHWFKWEAAITWASGIVLLVLVYYMGGIMVDTSVLEIDETTAILIGVAMLVLSWPVYDALWSSSLARRPRAATVVSYLMLVCVIFFATHVFGGRAAFIHIGAMMGGLMAVNVWARILPAQRSMVRALHEGKEPDGSLALQAKTRSKHNTFMVMPVVLIMISNHFPTISYGSEWNWLILSGLVLAGWGAAALVRRA